ncbi:MAG: hypothetical protein ACLP1D_07480 [Xanthobacteraceae bacterium]
MARKISKKAGKKSSTAARRKVAARPTAKKRVRVAYSKADVKELKGHSRAKTPLKAIAKAMKRTEGSLRQKAMVLGIPLGHRR